MTNTGYYSRVVDKTYAKYTKLAKMWIIVVHNQEKQFHICKSTMPLNAKECCYSISIFYLLYDRDISLYVKIA